MKKVLFAALCGFCFYGALAQDVNCKIEKSNIKTDDTFRSTVICVDDDGAGGSVIVRALSTAGATRLKIL